MKADEFVPEGFKPDTECDELAAQIALLDSHMRRSAAPIPKGLSGNLQAKDPAPKSTRVSLDEDPAARRLNGKSTSAKILWR